MQMSLDGYIEGLNKDMSWVQTNNPEGWARVFEMLKNVDLLVLGRGMFAEYRDYWKKSLTSPEATSNEVEYARYAEKTKHIVFSRTLKDPQWKNTEINSGDVVQEVEKLKRQSGADIYLVGGGMFASTVLDAGVVDELRLVINPYLLGGGKSLFKDGSKQSLELVRSTAMEGGILEVIYFVKGH